MSAILCVSVWITLATALMTFCSGRTQYQELMCQRTKTSLKLCKLNCSEGLARPEGCEICKCRESLCTKSTACEKGWHCETREEGPSYFPHDKPVCVPDQTDITLSVLKAEAIVFDKEVAATNLKLETITEIAESTLTTSDSTSPAKTTQDILRDSSPALGKRPSVSTTAAAATTTGPATAATTATKATALSDKSAPEPVTCEQKGRCDNTGKCLTDDYVCRSDGRCCKSDRDQDPYLPRCQQRPNFGLCRSSRNLFVYDITTSRCTQTIFGACSTVSENVFSSMEECQEKCERPCKQPQTDGPCRANIPRYYFNLTTLSCEIFDYGGCQGNRNNFVAKSDCEDHCRGLAKTEESVYSYRYRSAGKTHLYFHGRPGGNIEDVMDKFGNLQSSSTPSSTTPTKIPLTWFFFFKKYGKAQ